MEMKLKSMSDTILISTFILYSISLLSCRGPMGEVGTQSEQGPHGEAAAPAETKAQESEVILL